MKNHLNLIKRILLNNQNSQYTVIYDEIIIQKNINSYFLKIVHLKKEEKNKFKLKIKDDITFLFT